jgi:hypothetical protein
MEYAVVEKWHTPVHDSIGTGPAESKTIRKNTRIAQECRSERF